MKTLIFLFNFLFITTALAQNEVPDYVAKHGGIVQKTTHSFLEVVQEKERTNIYITGHDHKNITNQQLSLTAIALVNDKKYPLKLSYENDHYSVAPANSYLHQEKNMVLMLTISFPTATDKALFKLKSN